MAHSEEHHEDREERVQDPPGGRATFIAGWCAAQPHPIVAIAGMKRRQIHLLDGVEHEPREVLLRQLLTQARRQQQLLLTITRAMKFGAITESS